MALLPLLLVSALAYGIYRLRKLAKEYLIVAQGYAQKVQAWVERVSKSAANPLIQVHTKTHMVTTMIKNLTSRRL